MERTIANPAFVYRLLDFCQTLSFISERRAIFARKSLGDAHTASGFCRVGWQWSVYSQFGRFSPADVSAPSPALLSLWKTRLGFALETSAQTQKGAPLAKLQLLESADMHFLIRNIAALIKSDIDNFSGQKELNP